ARCLAGRELPPIDIDLRDAPLDGHRITFNGEDALTYRYQDGALLGYSGHAACEIAIDGRMWRFSDKPVGLAFTVAEKERLAEGVKAALLIRCDRAARLTVPCPFAPDYGAACALDFYQADLPVEWSYADGAVSVTVTEELAGKWIAVGAK
ncbi:MAG: hypothetical protein J5998_08030, partial [Clostridia bacterium]|nr:hypothetical protein [Clostridia bacterium]